MSTQIVERCGNRKLYCGTELYTDKGGFTSVGFEFISKKFMNKKKYDPIVFERYYTKHNGKRIVMLPHKYAKNKPKSHPGDPFDTVIYHHEITDNEMRAFISNDINLFGARNNMGVHGGRNKKFDHKKPRKRLTHADREIMNKKLHGGPGA